MNFLIIFFLMVSVAQAADVIYDKSTKEILFIEEVKDVNLSAEDKARVDSASLPDNFDKKELIRPVTDYQYIKGKIVLNTQKIAAAEDLLVVEAKKLQQEIKDRKSGMDKLEALGLSKEELRSLFK